MAFDLEDLSERCGERGGLGDSSISFSNSVNGFLPDPSLKMPLTGCFIKETSPGRGCTRLMVLRD